MAETIASKLAKRIFTDGAPYFKGTSAPAGAVEGDIFFNTTSNILFQHNGTEFVKVSAELATLSSVTGDYFEGVSKSLTLAGSGFLSANLVVTFTHSGVDRTVTVTPSSDTAASVTTPAALDSAVSAGDSVGIKVTNSDQQTSTTQTITVLALPTGGTITSAGGYRYHTFNSSSNFVVPSGFSATADFLLVAGGGGGGHGNGSGGNGGGGAGGAIDSTVSLSAQTYSIVIGSGGTGVGAGNSARGGDGNDSTAFGNTAVGGGGGGHRGAANGNSGGSGGGAGNTGANNGTGGSGTSGQGNSGGNENGEADQFPAGGGGGKGGAGGTPSSANDNGGDGGTGYNWKSLGTFYAGGGGGGTHLSGSAALGGSSVGGNGGVGSGQVATAGTANRGGGGGGSGQSEGGSAAGGSGIMIVRYAI